MTPRSDPHTEAIRATLDALCLDSLEVPLANVLDDSGHVSVLFQTILSELAALESERDEAVALAEASWRTAWAKAQRDWHSTAVEKLPAAEARAVAAEARVAQLEEAAREVLDYESHPSRAALSKLRSALGVVADGGGGRDGE